MFNHKLTALITSAIMALSTSTAAMSGFTTIAADNSALAASEEEHKVCCNCGKELPDNALPTALGVYVCSNCRSQGMGGTTTAAYTTTEMTTQTIGTFTSTGPSGSYTTPPAPVTVATTTDPTGYAPELHEFYVYVVNTDTNKVESNIYLDIGYDDGTMETAMTNSDGTATWIDSHGKEGGIYLGKLPDHLIGGGQVGHSIPEDGKGVILYVRNNPYFAYDYFSTTTTTTTMPKGSSETTYVTLTTTVPIKGEEMAIAVRSFSNYQFIGGAKLEITYDDGSTKIIKTKSDVPTILKHNGQGGTIKLIDIPVGFDLKYKNRDSYSFKPDTQFIEFDMEDISYKMGYIVPNKEYFVVKPGEEAEIGFKTKGVEVLGVECGIDEIKVKEWFMTALYPDNDATAIITVPADMETSYDWGYSLNVTYKPFDVDTVFVYQILFYVADDSTPTTMTTTTTTTTTTTACTETTYDVTSALADYKTAVDYDDSPMKIGEIRAVRIYDPRTGESTGDPSIDCTSPNATLTFDGADKLYVYATAPGRVEIYIKEANCQFGTYVYFDVLDEQFDGTNTTTATTTTTETTTFDSDTTTTTSTTSRLPGQGVDLLDFESVVIAIDDTAIQFESLNTYPLTNYSASQFEHVKPGDKVHVRFLSDTYEHGMVMNAFVVEVLDENCPVEATEKGDANCDGEMNMADAVLIMQCEANPDKYGIGLTTGINLVGAANCDVDGSGDVTNKDALKIQQLKLGIIKEI